MLTSLQKRAALDLAAKGWTLEEISTLLDIPLSTINRKDHCTTRQYRTGF